MTSVGDQTDYGTVLWVGLPEPRAHFTEVDVFLVPFSVLWVGMLVTGAASALAAGAPVFVLIPLAVMFAFGCHLMIGRFIVKARAKRATTYVLTDRYAIIDRGGGFESRRLDAKSIRIRRRAWSRLVDVDFEAGLARSRPSGYIYQWYANTGLDFFVPAGTGGWRPFRFYDVDDEAGIVDALGSAGIEMVDRGAASI
ncbi:hypothetical protein [Microbacterium sp. UBA837]|uniref:hypothetical protein n=1 Tax=Microbacterium sp. UBA837 TaxID=1946956 RepID=UPI0025CEAA46|nr:hypothetical protein [Microbacterium sp. UBA837]|tara:strand:+ start:2272 stop:2862 length:591 start_codon:yes stop_codon:yes gene_type:complete